MIYLKGCPLLWFKTNSKIQHKEILNWLFKGWNLICSTMFQWETDQMSCPTWYDKIKMTFCLQNFQKLGVLQEMLKHKVRNCTYCKTVCLSWGQPQVMVLNKMCQTCSSIVTNEGTKNIIFIFFWCLGGWRRGHLIKIYFSNMLNM